MPLPVVSEAGYFSRHLPRTGSLWLRGGRVGLGARAAVQADIEIRDGHIKNIVVCGEDEAPSQTAPDSAAVDLRGYLILPGLINTHDHLEFNLFPRLGHGPYTSYREWAADIYRPEESPLREHLAVPEAVRLWWGGLKNLIAGVTTVCHHNPYISRIFENDFPVRVVKEFAWSHSLAFGNDLKAAFSCQQDVPFIIHAGEGTDAQSAQEILTLHELGLLAPRTVLVHGVAFNKAGLSRLEELGSALVWCPSSNIFTLGRTLDFETVTRFGRISLGNDSALTAEGDLMDEIRFAHSRTGLSPARLYSMVSVLAADELRLLHGEGSLCPGARADLIALRDLNLSPAETIVSAGRGEVELSLLDGEPKLLSKEMLERWPQDFIAGMEPLAVGGVRRWLRAPVKWLFMEARRHLGSRICLGGKEVSL